ncbi:PAS domain S-box protein [Aerosakkonemataceae cyanobacterium BLCC-F50]|uniref:Oxygen sensor histidine kinase NreB n=1 Tax=Floridaenema flaviceps BLCC-F50 TaxID=3153642 RepID=A0ABV4XTV0_9CYAN
MLLKRLNHAVIQVSKTVPLQTVLIIPFVLQTLATVGLVGYFSFRNGQQTVNDLSGQLRRGITNRIEEKLKSYTEIPHTINRFNAIAFAENSIDVDNGKGEYQFWQQTLMFPSTSLIYCGSDRSGAILGAGKLGGENSLQLWISNSTFGNIPHFYSLNSQGKRDRLLGKDTKRFDARLRPWYKAAVVAGQPTWSPIYPDFTTGLPTITASMPIYDSTDRSLRGVCATDFFLPQEMNQFLKSLEIGKSGTAFIMERSGLLVSTSSEQTNKNYADATQRLRAIASENRTVQATAKYLRDRFGSFDRIQSSQLLDFKMDGKQQFVQVLPFQDRRGLNWLIVTVLPEADFMERIQANNRITILLCIAALIGGVTISILTARWITHPLVSLSHSAKALARKEWDRTVKIERSGDLGELATSFNQMGYQLQTSFRELQSLNEALSQNENRIKQFLEAVPVGIAVLDAAGHPYYVNQRAIQLLGKGSISSVSTEALSEIYQVYVAGTNRQYPTEKLPIVRALRGDRSTAEDLEIHQGDRIVPLESWGTPIFDEVGNVTYAIAAFQDITQRKQSEQLVADYNQTLAHQVEQRTAALRASEKKFALAFHASPVAMGILTIPHGKYMDVNDSFCRTMGYSREQVIGRTCADLKLWQHPEDRSRVFKRMEETGSVRGIEVEFRNQSGDTLIVRGSGEIIDWDGIPRILSLYEDVTEYRRIEAALRRQQELLCHREQELRLITDALPVCICYVDANRRYQFVNRTYEVWFGCRQDEMLGKHIREFLGEEIYQIAEPSIERALEGQVTTFEAEIPYPLGKKYISATFIPDFDRSNQVKGYYGLLVDISDRKRAEAASVLEERNRIAREIHDTLAQVLTGVIIQMETAKVVIPNDSRARNLIDTTYALAREGLAEARRSVWALRSPLLDREGLSHTLQRLVNSLTTGTTLQAQCQIQNPPYPLPSDIETNLLRIVQESTVNAIKHGNASKISIKLTFDSQVIRLRVQDNGDGFNPDRHNGLGFGLVGMRERVQNLGGQLRIDSQVGQGTEVVAIVPLAVSLPGKEDSV